jgi:uncharacterized NAD(P)/FAD-binding protein YdhS
MKSDSPAADVAIVGGGFSGTMMAAELARRGIGAVLIEGGGRAGRGTAYSTPEDVHLLNVPAGKMSAWADQPDHFADAVASEGFSPADFVPRQRYGTYLSGILREAGVEVVDRAAVGAKPDGEGWSVELADGRSIAARALVLAQGNQPPGTLGFARGISGQRFVNDPWSDQGRAAVARAAASGEDVLIIGTGLTMVDVVLSLDQAGHRGRILALSRRGLAPRAHAAHEPAPVEIEEVPQASVLALWHWLRRRGAEVGWRAAVDSLRPHSHALWQTLDEREQRQFIRHARPWWDVHRHRIAPEVAARLAGTVSEGRLEVAAGRIAAMREADGALRVEIIRRGRPLTPLASGESPSPPGGEGLKFALAVNCTGPLGSIATSADGVLRSLFGAGLARADALGMGLDVDAAGRVLRDEPSTGSVSPQDERQMLWALGPLTKGRFWEIVAVPDIRGQVAAVADDIAQELEHAMQS